MSKKIEFGRGAVVKCPVPNKEDPTKATFRNAIVLSDDGVNCDVLICPMTSQLHQQSVREFSFEIERYSSEGVEMGLNYDSLILIDRIGKVPRSIINKFVIGKTPDSILERIDKLYKQYKAKYSKNDCS